MYNRKGNGQRFSGGLEGTLGSVRLCFLAHQMMAKRLSVLVFVSQTLLRPLLFLRTETLAVAYISVLIP